MGRRKTNTPEILKKYKADYFQRNKARLLEKSRQWVLNNREKSKEHKKRWDNKNKEYKKQYALKNADRISVHKKNYEIRNRGKVLAAKSKWNSENKEYQKNYLKNNPEKFRSASLRRRASKFSNSTNKQIESANQKIIKMLSVEFSECPYCKISFKTSIMEVEHIVPLFKGGSHSAENIIMACEKCNGSKGHKILYLEWTPPCDEKK